MIESRQELKEYLLADKINLGFKKMIILLLEKKFGNFRYHLGILSIFQIMSKEYQGEESDEPFGS